MVTYQQHKEAVKYTIGAHDIPTILGVNPYKSAYQLYLEKKEIVERFEGNEATDIGIYFEETILKYFVKNVPTVTRLSLVDYTKEKGIILLEDERDNQRNVFVHPNQILVGKVDMLGIENGIPLIVEAKNSGEFSKKLWDPYPEMYYWQLQTYLELAQVNYGYIIGLLGGNHFVYEKIERNEDDIKTLIEAAVRFHKQLIENKEPTPTSIDRDAIEERYSDLEDTEIELLYALNDNFLKLDEIKQQQIELKEQRDAEENIIRDALGFSQAGSTDQWYASWKDTTSSRFDSKSFKVDHPDLFEKYIKKSTSRRLNISRKSQT